MATIIIINAVSHSTIQGHPHTHKMNCLYKPSKNTLGVKKGEAKSEAPVNIKTTESTDD